MVLFLRVVELVTSRPVVADRVGKDLAVAAKRARGNRLVHRLGGLQLRASIVEKLYPCHKLFLGMLDFGLTLSQNEYLPSDPTVARVP